MISSSYKLLVDAWTYPFGPSPVPLTSGRQIPLLEIETYPFAVG